jgi:diguanylate cyclase (GGDEF)-like protein
MDALEGSSGRASAGGVTVARQDDDPDPDAARALGLAARAAHGEAAPAAVTCGSARALARALPASDPSHPLGTIAIARHDRPFSAQDEELIGYLAAQCAVSLENARLHDELVRQATVDELTGLSNHRRLQQALDEELARSRRFPSPVSLLLLDIDDFKRVNDTYGHLQGDLVLREVARVLRQSSREIDEPARYGGEEMAVALPQTDLEGAFQFAERVRRRIEDLDLPLLDGDGTLKVTASFGAASLGTAIQVSSDGKDALVAAADAALYRAKRSGKNRTVRAE